MHSFKAAGKYIASFFLSEWRLEDYPLKTTFRGSAVENGRRKSLAWTVQVINWWHMRGDGDTQQDALENLRERLAVHKGKCGALPRPGRGAKLELEFAPSDRIQRYEDVAAHFFPAVLELQYGDCLVSDESSLWDFHDEATNATYEGRIRATYGVDVPDVESGNLLEIFQRIRAMGSHTE